MLSLRGLHARLPIPPPLLVLAVLTHGAGFATADVLWQAGGIPVCTAASNQLTPVGIPDGDGGAIVTWYDYRSRSADIYAQRVLPSGVVDPAWPAAGRALCLAPGGQYAPAIAPDGVGGAIVVWYDDRGSSSDIYAQRVLASGTVAAAWPTSGRAICAASGDQIYPAVTSDGAGGAIVTWRDDRGGPDTDIYAQRVLASGVVDPAWPANGLAICTAGGNQSGPAIASDGAGGALVTWSDLRAGTGSDIYVQRVLVSGAVDPAWPANGRAVCTAAGNQSGPTIVADGGGGAIVAWFDYRNALDADIYAQRVLASGLLDAGWPAGGRAVCAAPDEQYSPVVVSDGAGGAIVAWYDYRDGPEPDIYAQHIQSLGLVDPAWPPNGSALCTAGGEQSSPSITADGQGGALVAWFDYRDDPASDIYAQHVMPTGVVDPDWPVNGHALCVETGSQFSPMVVPDGAGGVIAAWTDFRGGAYSDVYAQRVGARLGAVDVGPAPPATFRLSSVRPNPSRTPVTIRMDLAVPQRLTVEVLDASGRRVRTLVAGGEFAAARHEFVWTGEDDAGAQRGGGVYWIRARSPAGSSARAMLILR